VVDHALPQPRDPADADDVIGDVLYAIEYLDCFRQFWLDPEPDYLVAVGYLEAAVDDVQRALDTAVERGHVRP